MAQLWEDFRGKARSVFGNVPDPGDDTEEQQPDMLEELSEYCPTLTWQQRLMGFFISFGMGYMIAFFSFRFFLKLIAGNPVPFAVNYTTGHILQLLASNFLVGPKRQFKNMFDAKRRITSMVYLSCLATTVVVIFIPFPSLIKLVLLLLAMMTQFCASLWYSLSYIPYGRQTMLSIIKSSLGMETGSRGGAYAGLSSMISGTV